MYNADVEKYADGADGGGGGGVGFADRYTNRNFLHCPCQKECCIVAAKALKYSTVST